MDLGIAGRHAVVCASSRGLGRACAFALAEAGCSIVLNGRDERVLASTAAALRAETGVDVSEVAGDVRNQAVRDALISVAPVDILGTNAAGPPLADFRDLDAESIRAGLESNMVTPIALIQAVADGMMKRGFGRMSPSMSMKSELHCARAHAGSSRRPSTDGGVVALVHVYFRGSAAAANAANTRIAGSAAPKGTIDISYQCTRASGAPAD